MNVYLFYTKVENLKNNTSKKWIEFQDGESPHKDDRYTINALFVIIIHF